MIEALDLAASVTAVIHISVKILSTFYQYWNTTTDAIKNIKDIIDEISELRDILSCLRSAIDDDVDCQTSRLRQLNNVGGALKGCEKVLQKLENMLEIDFQNKEQVDAICKKIILEGLNIYQVQIIRHSLEKTFLEMTKN